MNEQLIGSAKVDKVFGWSGTAFRAATWDSSHLIAWTDLSLEATIYPFQLCHFSHFSHF
jgi:hypothetical protein